MEIIFCCYFIFTYLCIQSITKVNVDFLLVITKEEYQKKRDEIEIQITELNMAEFNLNDEYINSNFDKSLIGKKVRCFDGEDYLGDGFLKGARIGCDDEIAYYINQIRKDGSMSSLRLRLYVNRVEVIE